MASITVHYVYYSRAGRRRSAAAQTNIIPSAVSTASEGMVTIPVFPTLVYDETEMHFAFMSVTGAASGNGLFTVPASHTVEVSDSTTAVEVTVVYLPQGGDGPGTPGVYSDSFIVNTGQFSDSDFVDIYIDNVLDAAKTFTANEDGWIGTEIVAEMRSKTAVDGYPFLHWDKIDHPDAPHMNISYLLELHESGYVFAFYERKDTTIPEIDPPKLGWIYVSPGVKVDGGGFVLGPKGPVPVDPWSKLFIQFTVRVAHFFNQSRTVSQPARSALSKIFAYAARQLGARTKG